MGSAFRSRGRSRVRMSSGRWNPDGDRFVQRLIAVSGFDIAGTGLLVRREGSPEDPGRPTWNRPVPPYYFWTDELPTEWLRLAPHQEATEAVWAMMLEHRYEPSLSCGAPWTGSATSAGSRRKPDDRFGRRTDRAGMTVVVPAVLDPIPRSADDDRS